VKYTPFVSISIVAGLALIGCRLEAATREITGNTALQQPVAGQLTLLRDANPDSAYVTLTVPVPDSSAHRNWRPASVRVTSSEGYDEILTMTPFACLTPASGSRFPFSFHWLSCDRVQVETSRMFSADELASLEEDLSAKLIWLRPFSATSGATYLLRVPIGESSTAEAARRAALHSGVTSAAVPTNDPACVLSDDVPPPACPPWSLRLTMPFAPQSNSRDTISVKPCGWIQATYDDPAHASHVVTWTVPPAP
jgi:hypothetical protein